METNRREETIEQIFLGNGTTAERLGLFRWLKSNADSTGERIAPAV
ncbi:hypothetical protein ACVMIH_007681 [Bradyrhizobium sp. USDA 4503]